MKIYWIFIPTVVDAMPSCHHSSLRRLRPNITVRKSSQNHFTTRSHNTIDYIYIDSETAVLASMMTEDVTTGKMKIPLQRGDAHVLWTGIKVT